MFEVDGATGVIIAGTRLPALPQLFLYPCQLPLQAFDAVEGVVEACVVERLEPSADGGECAAKFSLLGDRMDCVVGHRKAPRCARPGSPARKPHGLTGSHNPATTVSQLTDRRPSLHRGGRANRQNRRNRLIPCPGAPSCPSSLSLPQSAWATWICPIASSWHRSPACALGRSITCRRSEE